MRGDVSDHRRAVELVEVALMVARQVRSGVGKVEYLEIRAVGQHGQEYFNQWVVRRKVRGRKFQGRPVEVSKERRSPTDQNVMEAKGGEVWYWAAGWPFKFHGEES
jgi:hypothetical protein